MKKKIEWVGWVRNDIFYLSNKDKWEGSIMNTMFPIFKKRGPLRGWDIFVPVKVKVTVEVIE